MKKSKLYYVFLALSAVLFVVSLALYYIPQFKFSDDKTVNELVGGVLIRGGAALLLIMIAAGGTDKRTITPNVRYLGRNLLLSIPCLLVAVVNFPFSAIITGSATVVRVDLIWLFALSCLAIGVSEEIFFRGLLQSYLSSAFKGRRFDIILTVAVTSAAFSLWHLFNAFTSSFGAVLYQMGYTFLLGGMFSVLMFLTEDIWLCVFFHALFDFGGGIITSLGEGKFQDTTFWILTVSVGILCGAYIIYNLIKLQFKDRSLK